MQRVVFPAGDTEAVLPLYLEPGAASPTGRLGARVPAGSRLRLQTYFNCFPASYWRHWGRPDQVRLDVRLDRPARVEVWRSDARGTARLVATADSTEPAFDLPLDSGFDEGGHYWLELDAGDEPVELLDSTWSVASLPAEPGTVSVGITTFNRPGYALAQLQRLAAEPVVLALIDRIYLVDQGTDLVSGQDGFAAVASVLGERLAVVRQPNLGGSGGFSRAMAEALREGRSRYVLVLDDDAIGEPEAILRAVRFADAARRPLLVGGAMFHLDDRSVLYTQGERIDTVVGLAGPVPEVGYDTDLATSGLRTNPALHQRHDVTFNGWWMTLIPTSVLADLGLALPYFIKWDDLEFALRCHDAGVPTVSLPGVAVWHQAWHDKFSWRNWETFFTERNMWLTLMTHVEKPSRVPLRAFLADVGMVLSLQYSSVALRIAGREEAAGGLVGMHDRLAHRLAEVTALRRRYRDTDKRPDAGAFPPVSGSGTRPASGDVRARDPELRGPADIALAMRVAASQLLRSVPASALAAPAVELDGHEAIWRQFLRNDSALVRYPDGYVWVVRDRREAWRLLRASAASTWRLRRVWRRLHRDLRQQWRAAASPDAWWRTFAAR